MDDQTRAYIKQTKNRLRKLQDVKAAFSKVQEQTKRDVDAIRELSETGRSVIPEISYASIRDGKVSNSARNEVRLRGAAIVRGVFPSRQAEEWNAELGAYIDDNDYYKKAEEKAGLDKYFSALQSGKPQIFGVYWSKPQVLARQAETMAHTKQFLNNLWNVSGPMGDEFDPNQDYAYADRIRRREPGDKTLGLSPHMDSGSYERWVDPAYQRIYGSIFEGAGQEYDPWKATFRTQTREFSSPAVCSMFRTFQGWTALTAQGPQDGTLSVIPSARGIAYFLLRALQDDVPDDDLCGAERGRALSASPKWHGDILGGLVSIPLVEPGDTVWWHPDIIHSVADHHQGQDYANVIYIGASPHCAKNEAYIKKQSANFLAGKSAPDFAAENYEMDFRGRATIDDLSDLGRSQMGL